MIQTSVDNDDYSTVTAASNVSMTPAPFRVIVEHVRTGSKALVLLIGWDRALNPVFLRPTGVPAYLPNWKIKEIDWAPGLSVISRLGDTEIDL
jgi:hypothetical protein